MHVNLRFQFLARIALIAVSIPASLISMPMDHALAKRLLPVDNLAYPVLITLKTGGYALSSGSGVYLNASDGIYLVTAKHMLEIGLPDPMTEKIEFPDLDLELLSYSGDPRILQKKRFFTLTGGTLEQWCCQDE